MWTAAGTTTPTATMAAAVATITTTTTTNNNNNNNNNNNTMHCSQGFATTRIDIWNLNFDATLTFTSGFTVFVG